MENEITHINLRSSLTSDSPTLMTTPTPSLSETVLSSVHTKDMTTRKVLRRTRWSNDGPNDSVSSLSVLLLDNNEWKLCKVERKWIESRWANKNIYYK